MLNNLVKNATYKEITYNEFIEMVNNDEVKSVALEQDRIQYLFSRVMEQVCHH